MGSSISQTKAVAKKGNADNLRVTNDALASLQDLAALQVQLFQSKVRLWTPFNNRPGTVMG